MKLGWNRVQLHNFVLVTSQASRSSNTASLYKTNLRNWETWVENCVGDLRRLYTNSNNFKEWSFIQIDSLMSLFRHRNFISYAYRFTQSKYRISHTLFIIFLTSPEVFVHEGSLKWDKLSERMKRWTFWKVCWADSMFMFVTYKISDIFIFIKKSSISDKIFLPYRWLGVT
jgi:hypothetical protein